MKVSNREEIDAFSTIERVFRKGFVALKLKIAVPISGLVNCSHIKRGFRNPRFQCLTIEQFYNIIHGV